VVCAYVWCDVNFAYTMFVCIARNSSEVPKYEDHPGTWNLEPQASCALKHFSLPNNVPVNHCDMLKII
jgi:hypothetical protein